MKKVLLSGSLKKMFLAFAMVVSYAGNLMAQIEVSEPDANDVVTITTTEAGQIGAVGQWGNYVWNSEVSESQKTAIKKAKGVKLVGFVNSTDVKSLVEGCKNSQNHVYWSVLDMGNSEFTDELKVDAGEWSVSAHCFVPQPYYQIHCTSLKLPKLAVGSAIPAQFASVIYDLKSVTIPEGYTEIGDKAFYNNCFFKNLTFPESLRKIGHMAFVGGINDVYFLGKVAPETPWDAFDTKAYLNNSSIKTPTNAKYTATRDNYYKDSENYCAAVLHLRSDLTPAERAAFTDVTRKYHVFGDDNRDIESSDESAEYFENGVKTVNFGKEVSVKHGSMAVWTVSKLSYDGKAESTAYYDTRLGSQYIWPNQAQFNRSYACANSGLLWNGETTIGDGIRNAGNTSYVGDGSEYAGLHEFVLVSNDITGTKKPDEWGFDNIGEANWYTICIPVNMTVKQVRETFGEETQVCKFSKVTRNSDVKVRLEFKDEQCYGKEDLNAIAIAANEAYMIRPGSYPDALTKFTLKGYEIDEKVAPIPTTIAVTDEGKTAHTPEGGHKYTFVGNYQNGERARYAMPQYSYYLGADRQNPTIHKLFFQVGTSGSWSPYTCVVLVDNGDGTGEEDYYTFFEKIDTYNNAKGCNSYFGADPSTTDIEEVEIIAGKDNERVNGNATIYDMNGRVVNTKGETNNLSKGVYIQNGKKFIVK